MIHHHVHRDDRPNAQRRAVQRTTGSEMRDAGLALPLALILTTVIAAAVLVLANYAITSLKYANVTEQRSDRLSAADAGMRYAIDQLKLRNAGCILDTQKALLPGVQADFNGASASVTCERITNGFDGIQAYAAVMTGEGLPASTSLLSSQSGSTAKVLGGPVYMSRIDTAAFSLTPPVRIEDGPLLYHDTSGSTPCTSVPSSSTPGNLVFEPELIFGPVCVSVSWDEIFDSPTVPDLTTLVPRDGTLPLASSPALPAPQGSYTDVTGGGGCRVFEPGYYTTPPALTGRDAYFKTGDYVFDFNGELQVRQSVTTAGRLNPLTTTVNEVAPTNACLNAQNNDPAPASEFGATFYFAGNARINVATQGSLEIHARQQGAADYVSVQALCTPNTTWCNADGGGSFPTPKASTIAAPASPTFLYTDSGNNKEFIAHALVYAPRGQVEFGNVSNTAIQKMLGGLIVSRLVLQSATSATNFEISVPTSPITAEIKLTSTAVKEGETSIQAVVQYRPYESGIDDRVRINSWRVCDTPDCGNATGPSSGCGSGDAAWTADFYSNPNLTGTPVWSTTTTSLSPGWGNWGSGSPNPAVPVNNFSARFTRTIDFPSPGTYQFTIGTDDGQRFRVNGAMISNDWNIQDISAGTNTVTATISDRCAVDLELEYYENSGQAEVFLTWVKL